MLSYETFDSALPKVHATVILLTYKNIRLMLSTSQSKFDGVVKSSIYGVAAIFRYSTYYMYGLAPEKSLRPRRLRDFASSTCKAIEIFT